MPDMHRFFLINPFRFAFRGQLIFKNRIARVFRPSLFVAVPDFPKSAAFFARAVRRVEREQPRIEFLEGAAAPGTIISVLITVSRCFESSRCAVPRPISSAR